MLTSRHNQRINVFHQKRRNRGSLCDAPDTAPLFVAVFLDVGSPGAWFCASFFKPLKLLNTVFLMNADISLLDTDVVFARVTADRSRNSLAKS